MVLLAVTILAIGATPVSNGPPIVFVGALSRSFTVLNRFVPPTSGEAISRSYTVFNRTGTVPGFGEAVSRSVTLFNTEGSDVMFTEVLSRSVTVFNRQGAVPVITEALSRSATIFNRSNVVPAFRETLSRSVTLSNVASVGDCKLDGDSDLRDFSFFGGCVTGAGGNPIASGCHCADFDGDSDVDLLDFGAFQTQFSGQRG